MRCPAMCCWRFRYRGSRKLSGVSIPLLAEEGWRRHQQEVAKPPKCRRRGGQTGELFRRTDHQLRLRPIGLAPRLLCEEGAYPGGLSMKLTVRFSIALLALIAISIPVFTQSTSRLDLLKKEAVAEVEQMKDFS